MEVTFTAVGAVLVGAVAWVLLHRRSLVGLVLCFGYLGFGAAAVLLYHVRPSDFAVRPSVSAVAEQTPRIEFYPIFIVAAASVALGGYVTSRRREGTSRLLTPLAQVSFRARVLALAPIPLGMDLVGVGWTTFLHAPSYLSATGPHLFSVLGAALSPIGVLLAAYFALKPEAGVLTRITGSVIAIGYEVVYFGNATRYFAIWPVLVFVAGLFSRQWSSKRRTWWALVVALAVVVADQIPLGLRGMPLHGLVPAMGYLFFHPGQLFGQDLAGNSLFGAPLTYWIEHDVATLPMHYLWTALNPLPSGLTDWYAIQPALRVNNFTPYSALGELINHGWVLFIVIMSLMGALFSLAERQVLSARRSVQGVGWLLVIGLAGLFVIESTEYNLRSSARLADYALCGALVLRWVLPAVRNVFGVGRKSWQNDLAVAKPLSDHVVLERGTSLS